MYYITLKSIKYNSCVYMVRDDQLGLIANPWRGLILPLLASIYWL